MKKSIKESLVKFFTKETLKNLWKNDKKAILAAASGACVALLGTVIFKGRRKANK